MRPQTLLARLARDVTANTSAIIAASVLPLLAMVGGGVDMGRAYVAQNRLQQACDAGVLAARKQLGSDLPPSNRVVGEILVTGNEFFDLNFRRGLYDAEQRRFQMTLEADYAITGDASIELPTAIMGVFGFQTIPIATTCQARLNFQNLDIVMAIDTTGSMAQTNAGDTQSRLDSVRAVITDFHAELEGNKEPETRIRYGFVPYGSNVNVGHLLDDNWVVNEWTYQSRVSNGPVEVDTTETVNTNWRYVSGNRSEWAIVSTYDASLRAGTTDTYDCTGSRPSNTLAVNDVFDEAAERTEPFAGPPAGEQTIRPGQRTENGSTFRTVRNGQVCEVQQRTYTDYVNNFDRITRPVRRTMTSWTYRPVTRSTAGWRTDSNGCIEERSGGEILDYDNVDLATHRDLDLDSLPNRFDPDTQWRPQYPSIIYARALKLDGTGAFNTAEVTTTDEYVASGNAWYATCPARAERLTTMNASDLQSYLGTLRAQGSTYHDIGMIWAGRLISPTGLWASANRDVSANQPTKRHIIFLTDGQTEPLDVVYGTYGLEPLDQRRWSSGSALSLAETVEERFLFACKEAKKKNVTVWVIAFGTSANPKMTECAGSGRYFEAADAAQLDDAFSEIAKSLGDLRISR